ncbi:formate dehydrogenase FDH3 subunit beta [Vibrio hippocampi]|uniref:Formate dehydrogenase iron-sulfur subunit n=1 Tax=Vibrio hippocampi TaxID=654686 RepID=A0ABN8DKU6_9VIBR|nr:formate dehydrogenase FDH3 subunit beta [Vibrio hippocampi]CAH0525966.1 Formate dehydrogenase iron-sulfur subunit [Vibrio hippocampi]
MARMKFMCDTKRCIECNGCVTACKNANDDALEWGIQRRRVVTLNDGLPGENSISVACMHCTDAPCVAVCPADCFEYTEDGIVRHNKDLCIGCGYCLFACPFGAPQFPKQSAFGERGKMDKCTFCAGGPETEPGSAEEKAKYGANRIAEGKLPMCAELCSTKSLLAGDAEKISDIFRQRVVERGAKGAGWSDGNDIAYDATKS